MSEVDLSESEILFQLIKKRYGEKLSQKEISEVKKKVERIVDAANSVRSVKLENWIEPFTIFKPYKGEE